MNVEYGSVYLPTNTEDTFESTPLCNAGWYEQGQHGGALAALIVGRAESIPTLTPMQVARVTVEMFRVTPMVPLTVRPTVIREGKRIQTVKVEVTDSDDTLLSLGIVQRLRTADRDLPPEAATEYTELPGPDEAWAQIPGPGVSASSTRRCFTEMPSRYERSMAGSNRSDQVPSGSGPQFRSSPVGRPHRHSERSSPVISAMGSRGS